MDVNENRPVEARVKLVVFAGVRLFGPGICELLEHIRETGSIQAAAGRMRMSYTKAWRILNRAEAGMGVSLIERVAGGRNGGRSSLTQAGARAVAAYRAMEARLSQAGAELLSEYRGCFEPEEGERDDLPG